MRSCKITFWAAIALTAFAAANAQTPVEKRHPDAPFPSSTPGEGATAVSIPMRDGVILSADLYLPKDRAKAPVIIEMTPYGKRGNYAFASEHEFWTKHGFAVLIVEVRGTSESGGEFKLFNDARRDGPDIIRWATSQHWSTGRAGMRGSSYSGTMPFYVAAENPKGLACISPSASLKNPFQEPPFLGGALMQGWAFGWMQLVDRARKESPRPPNHEATLGLRPFIEADTAAIGAPLPLFRTIAQHQTLDDYWRDAILEEADYRRIEVPTLAFTGWYDTQLPGSYRHYEAMQKWAVRPGDHWILIGPWDHAGATEGGYSYETGLPMDSMGPIKVPSEGFLPGQRITLAFFDWCLKGGRRPDWPNVQVYVPGQNRWLHGQALPIEGVAGTKLYLSAEGPANGQRRSMGRLEREPGSGGQSQYTYDPANPVRADTGPLGQRRLIYGPADVSAQLERPDVLTYSTDPLRRPMTILGRVTLEAWVATDARDTDFVALLEDVAPDGSAIRLATGWAGILRARYRNGPHVLTLMTPGEPTRIQIDLTEIGHTLMPGHRLRLSFTSSAFPFIQVNPNTGEDPFLGTSPGRPARQTLFFGRERPSFLYLPVLTEK